MPTISTKTVKSSGGDYTSLSAWEAGEQANLVTGDTIAQAECYSFTDTTDVLFGGWTTDATRYIRVYTPSTERYPGKFDNTKYNLNVDRVSLPVLRIEVLNIRFEGIQVKVNKTADGFIATGFQTNLFSVSNVDIRIDQCLVNFNNLDAVNYTWNAGYHFNTSGSTNFNVYISNSVVYGVRGYNTTSGNWGFHVSGTATLLAYNCTAYDCSVGFDVGSGGTFIAKNCLAQGCTDGFQGTFDSGSTNNCSDITSDAPGSNAVTGTASFVDATNKDFHLSASDTVAKDAGTDLSGDATYPITIDIDYQTRAGSWDIGADEVVSLSQFPRRWATAV